MATIGLYIGTQNDQTKQIHEKQPWDEYLSDHKVEAFGSSALSDTVAYDQRIFTTTRNPSGALQRIYSAMMDCNEYLSRNSPDILMQLMRHPTHAPGISLAGRQNHVPVISRYAGDDFNSYKIKTGFNKLLSYLFSNGLGRIPLRYSEKMIALGPYTKRLLVERGFPQNDVAIIPVSINMDGLFISNYDQQETRKELDIPIERTVVLYAGRLTRNKGMDFLEEVIRQVICKDPSVYFIMAGDGPYKEHFRSLFGPHYVKCPGNVDYENIHLYYKSSDAYIHPSPYEGMPLSIVEALSCEVPVVARDAGDVSFITPNIVTKPSEMAERIVSRNWSSEWLNKNQFDSAAIKRKLNRIIEDSRKH